jgi:O-antigen/teichoic acid export membrane protein
LPLAAVAFYVVPYSLAEKTWMGVGNVTSVIFPSASELSAMGANEKLRELYVRATKMVILAALPVTVVLLGLAEQILHYWVSSEFAEHGTVILQLLASGFLFNTLCHVPSVVAMGIGRPWIAARYSLINAVLNVAGFLLLIPRYGAVGAAWGFFLSQLVLVLPYVWEVNRLLAVSWRSLISTAYLRPLTCGLGTVALLAILRPCVDSLLKVFLCCGAGLSAYALLAVVFAIDRRERSGVFAQLLRVFRSRSHGAETTGASG